MASHLSEAQLAELRNQLKTNIDDLDEMVSERDSFGLHESLRDSFVELSTFDNHPGDIGTETFERGKDLALNAHAMRQLRDSERALHNMQEGDYGICLTCKQPIPFERLQALPTAEFCVEHSPKKFVGDDRPIEELTMDNPFGRTSLDEFPQMTQFDGEDTWQALQKFGNSNSPAMSENRNVDDYDEMIIEMGEQDDGYVERIEGFLVTDIHGANPTFVRNREYRRYMKSGEGVDLSETDSLERE